MLQRHREVVQSLLQYYSRNYKLASETIVIPARFSEANNNIVMQKGMNLHGAKLTSFCKTSTELCVVDHLFSLVLKGKGLYDLL